MATALLHALLYEYLDQAQLVRTCAMLRQERSTLPPEQADAVALRALQQLQGLASLASAAAADEDAGTAGPLAAAPDGDDVDDDGTYEGTLVDVVDQGSDSSMAVPVQPGLKRERDHGWSGDDSDVPKGKRLRLNDTKVSAETLVREDGGSSRSPTSTPTPVDMHEDASTMLKGDLASVKRRIAAFQRHKQAEVDQSNRSEFGARRSEQQQHQVEASEQSARTSGAAPPLIKRVDILDAAGDAAPNVSWALEERLGNLENTLLPSVTPGPTPQSVWQRLKSVEDRVLELERHVQISVLRHVPRANMGNVSHGRGVGKMVSVPRARTDAGVAQPPVGRPAVAQPPDCRPVVTQAPANRPGVAASSVLAAWAAPGSSSSPVTTSGSVQVVRAAVSVDDQTLLNEVDQQIKQARDMLSQRQAEILQKTFQQRKASRKSKAAGSATASSSTSSSS